MFSLQKVLGKEDRFLSLLEASARQGALSVQALSRVVKDVDQSVALEEFALLRNKDRHVTQAISEAVYTTFVTALDREDIEQLSTALYKIPKMVEKFAERLLTSPL